MKMLWLVIGVIVAAAGAMELSSAAVGLQIPHISWRLDAAFGYLPVSTTYSSLAVTVLGVLLVLFGGFKSEMGKYFKFY